MGLSFAVVVVGLLAGCMQAQRPYRFTSTSSPELVDQMASTLASEGHPPAQVDSAARVVITQWHDTGFGYGKVGSSNATLVRRYLVTALPQGEVLVRAEVQRCATGSLYGGTGVELRGRCEQVDALPPHEQVRLEQLGKRLEQQVGSGSPAGTTASLGAAPGQALGGTLLAQATTQETATDAVPTDGGVQTEPGATDAPVTGATPAAPIAPVAPEATGTARAPTDAAAPAPAAAKPAPKGSGSDWMDVRLSFVFGDDNVLAGAGETNPSSPSARFGGSSAFNQFFDNVNSRFSGFESLANLVLYKEMPSFFTGVKTAAALHVRLLEERSGSINLRDTSSYVLVSYRPPSWGDKESISFTGFPVSSDRFRLGYLYRLTWGGETAFGFNAVSEGVPAAKLQLTQDRWYAYAGMKTGQLLNELILEKETLYGFLGGAGVDVLETLRLEAGAGYFQKGVIPGLATQGINAPVNAWGVSGQAVWHVGEPVGISVDLKLYRNDPNVYEQLFRPERYPGGLSYTVSLEGSYLQQTVEDPDVFAQTVRQSAQAAAIQARVKYDYARFHVTGLYRTVSFIQFDVPSFPSFVDFPDGSELTPEMFVAAGADYHFPTLHFTPGFVFGVQQVASITSPRTLLGGNNPGEALEGEKPTIIRDARVFDVLPAGFDPLLVLSAKATFRWDLSEILAAIGEVYYTRDPNRPNFQGDAVGINQTTFDDPNAIGFTTMLQARF